MFNPYTPHGLVARDAASDAQVAMLAYQAAIAYSINFIVLYLALTMAVVATVVAMGSIASPRVKKSPVFTILVVVTCLCVAAAAVNISQCRDLVVDPSKGVDRVRYTALIALSFLIPFFCDFTLIFRILAFYPNRSCAWWKPYAAIAFPVILKVPRFVFIVLYIHYCWKATEGAADMSVIVNRVNQTQYASCDWILMLADGAYSTVFLGYKLYRLGWGWGEEKHISRSFITTLRTIMYSLLASFCIPSFILIVLIAMQLTKYRPDREGYVFVTFIHVAILGSAFACLWPAIRADRHRSKMELTNGCTHSRSCHTCAVDRSMDSKHERGGGTAIKFQRSSVHKTSSFVHSADLLLDPSRSPSLKNQNSTNRLRSDSSPSKKALSYSTTTDHDPEAGYQLAQVPVLESLPKPPYPGIESHRGRDESVTILFQPNEKISTIGEESYLGSERSESEMGGNVKSSREQPRLTETAARPSSDRVMILQIEESSQQILKAEQSSVNASERNHNIQMPVPASNVDASRNRNKSFGISQWIRNGHEQSTLPTASVHQIKSKLLGFHTIQKSREEPTNSSIRIELGQNPETPPFQEESRPSVSSTREKRGSNGNVTHLVDSQRSPSPSPVPALSSLGRKSSSGVGQTYTVIGSAKLIEQGRLANPADLSGIRIETTQEQWSQN